MTATARRGAEERAQDIASALVLLGDTDLVPVAQAVHRRNIGAERPFVVYDPRRLDVSASARSAEQRGR